MDKLQKIAEQLLCDLEVTSSKELKLDAIKDAMLKYCSEHNISTKINIDADDIQFSIDSFAKFWEKYGKKVGRTPAEKKWMKLKKADIARILATVDNFVLAHPDVQYRPHPVTYINQRRWEDELPGFNKQPSRTPAKVNTWAY